MRLYNMDAISQTRDSNKNAALKKRLMQLLIMTDSASISDMAKELDVSIPTVTKFVYELLDKQFLVELGKQSTSGGRKPSIYGLNPDSGYFVGVDVQRKKILFATIDFRGKLVSEPMEVPYNLEDTPEALNVLSRAIKEYIACLGVPRQKILQIGVNIASRVNSEKGYSYSFFYFNQRPLARVLEEHLGIPVYLENDSRSMAYGEYMMGVVKDENNVLFLNLNWGLGAGIIIGGKLYYGKSGFSGEIGHICAVDNEVICNCGKKGCLETEASGFAVERMLKERLRQGCSTILADMLEEHGEFLLSDFVEAVLKEDVLAIEMVEHIGHVLGRWIAGFINVLNPELVVIGGPLSATQEYLRLPMQSAIRKYSLNLVNQDTKLVVSQLGENGGLMGVCLLSRSHLLGMI